MFYVLRNTTIGVCIKRIRGVRQLTPVRCDDCNEIMDRIEISDWSKISYSWNENIKEYDKVDEDWGDTNITYECPRYVGNKWVVSRK